MRNGRTIGVVLLGLLAVWIGYTAVSGELNRPSVPSAGIDSAFEGDLALPKAEINSKLNDARDRVLSVMDKAYSFRIASRVTAWFAFFATAAITLVAGWYGQMPSVPSPGNASAAATAAGLPQRAARAVTLLASLAAVLTAGGGLATQEAESLATEAQARQRELIDARKQILVAPNADAARTILDDLALHLRQ